MTMLKHRLTKIAQWPIVAVALLGVSALLVVVAVVYPFVAAAGWIDDI